MPHRIPFLLPALFLLCAAGAARGQGPMPCDNKPVTDPAYYADVKPMPPGKFGFGYVSDMKQFNDPSAPVAISGLSSVNGPKPRTSKPYCAEVLNRTERVVKSVRLRWTVTALTPDMKPVENAEVLVRGLLPAFEVEVPPGGKGKFEMRGVHFADFFQPLAAAGEINGKFNVIIGVAHVEFADGTSLDLP